jgi:CheY-like chemotaxis protein
VDDNADVVTSLALLLGEAGHDVHVAYDGWRALELARSLRPEYLFLDLGMPGLDGFQVAATLRRESALDSMKIIAATAYSQDNDRLRAQEAGFDYYLVKPVDFAFIESLLGGSRNRPA